MKSLLAFSRAIDALNSWLGRFAEVCVVLAVTISAGNAMIRYAYDRSSNAWLEIQWYLFAAMVMLGAAYTLRRNEHVRVDILYILLSPRGRTRLDVLGTIFFLIPSMLLIAWYSIPFYMQSWSIQEISSNAGGLIRWPVKLLVPLGFVLVALQGVSEIIKRVNALRHGHAYDATYERPVQ